MPPCASVFLQSTLPNATTWFYFSFLLAVALFFKFSRLLSVRNLDVVLAFLPVPGLLLLTESGGASRAGFAWLLGASVVLLARCVFDLFLVRRPALAPNLTPGGLAWLAAALFGSLVVVAVQEPKGDPTPADDNAKAKTPPVLDKVSEEGGALAGRLPLPDRQLAVNRALAVTCHLFVVAAAVVIGWRHFGDAHAGVAVATFYLLMPYTYLLMPQGGNLGGQWHDAWATALILWALVLYRRPSLSGLLLGVAAASVYYPVLLVPVWLGFYGGRGGVRFGVLFVTGAVLCVVWLLGLALLQGEGVGPLTSAWPTRLRDWLPWVSPSAGSRSLWEDVHWAYRMPVVLVYAVFVGLAVFWPARKNLAHLLALTAALLVGTQLWYADRGGLHVLWYLPLFLLLAFRPNLSTAVAPPIAPESDWLARSGRLLRRWLARTPEPAASHQ